MITNIETPMPYSNALIYKLTKDLAEYLGCDREAQLHTLHGDRSVVFTGGRNDELTISCTETTRAEFAHKLIRNKIRLEPLAQPLLQKMQLEHLSYSDINQRLLGRLDGLWRALDAFCKKNVLIDGTASVGFEANTCVVSFMTGQRRIVRSKSVTHLITVQGMLMPVVHNFQRDKARSQSEQDGLLKLINCMGEVRNIIKRSENAESIIPVTDYEKYLVDAGYYADNLYDKVLSDMLTIQCACQDHSKAPAFIESLFQGFSECLKKELTDTANWHWK